VYFVCVGRQRWMTKKFLSYLIIMWGRFRLSELATKAGLQLKPCT
jgi:hypothetical protein